MKPIRRKRGGALVVVLCLVFLGGTIAARLGTSTGSQILRSRALIQSEQAFYIAEGAAERAASHIAAGGAVPTTLTGTLGAGAFHTVILVEAGGGGLAASLSGVLQVNPHNDPDNSFLLVRPDGSQILRTGLTPYEGPAGMVLIRPGGSGGQSLVVNSQSYAIQNQNTYSFAGDLQVRLAETGGNWTLELQSANATVGNDAQAQVIRRDTRFTIHSEGRVGAARRHVTIRGLQTVSWAKYALWYNQENPSGLVIVGGEFFRGPVYANQPFRFHSHNVASHGQARFFDTAASTASGYTVNHSSVNPVFDKGLTLNAPVETMASVDFAELRRDASLVLDGTTTIRLNGSDVFITNSRAGWSNRRMDLPEDGLIYVRTATGGTSSTRAANVTISAPSGLSGRLTVAAEQDILIDNHIRYSSNPDQNPSSTDALGLIAARHTRITTAAPNNLQVFAHIICRDGGFGVDNYNSGSFRGSLYVHGGIVNRIRNAVGTTSGTGYAKNYVYDTRFRREPPPRYPALPDEFQWLGWEG